MTYNRAISRLLRARAADGAGGHRRTARRLSLSSQQPFWKGALLFIIYKDKTKVPAKYYEGLV